MLLDRLEWILHRLAGTFFSGLQHISTQTIICLFCRNLIRPDARFVLKHASSFWLEFDNDTEPTRVPERKFLQYVNSLTLTNNTKPVVWVAISRLIRF